MALWIYGAEQNKKHSSPICAVILGPKKEVNFACTRKDMEAVDYPIKSSILNYFCHGFWFKYNMYLFLVVQLSRCIRTSYFMLMIYMTCLVHFFTN
jgi:hypothetical protein